MPIGNVISEVIYWFMALFLQGKIFLNKILLKQATKTGWHSWSKILLNSCWNRWYTTPSSLLITLQPDIEYQRDGYNKGKWLNRCSYSHHYISEFCWWSFQPLRTPGFLLLLLLDYHLIEQCLWKAF